MSSFWKLHLLNKERRREFIDTEDRGSQKLNSAPGLWCQVSNGLFVSSLPENRLTETPFPELRRLRQEDRTFEIME